MEAGKKIKQQLTIFHRKTKTGHLVTCGNNVADKKSVFQHLNAPQHV